MTQNPRLSVFDASAGSGKTFQLVVQYLSLCLSSPSPEYYQRVLAITFTNKAAAEMKERILVTLDLISRGMDTPEADIISQKTQLSKEALTERAARMRTHILHNYHSFSISTIDFFTHKIIRTFANDLDLPHAFEVELDEKSLRVEAIDSMLTKVGHDPRVTEVLLQFIKEQLGQDKSWKVETKLQDISSVISQENSIKSLENLKTKDIDTFLKAQTEMKAFMKSIEGQLKKIGKEGCKVIGNITPSSFVGGRNTLVGIFQKWSSGTLAPLNKTVLSFLEGKFTSAKAPAHDVADIEAIADVLGALISDANELLTPEVISKYTLYNEAMKNIFSLALLNEINLELQQLKVDQQKIPISDFNRLINEQIKDQPTPYIYERLGEKYKHFFIDEFQDTSFLQFTNLLPLINNALAENGTCLLVGDAKQSIYRWRGGDASLFIQLSEKGKNEKLTFDNGHSLIAESQKVSLDDNYRSAANIVTFNTDFFQSISSVFSDDLFSKLYQSSGQKIIKSNPGYIYVEGFTKDQKDIDPIVKTTLEIKRLVEEEKAFHYRDICLLFRKNKEARKAVDYLLKQNIPVLSSDALYIGSSPFVQLILSFLALFARGYESQRAWQFAVNYCRAFDLAEDKKHEFISSLIHLSENDFWKTLREIHQDLNPHLWSGKTLFSLVETALHSFGLLTHEDAYLQGFLDLTLEFSKSKDGSSSGFLDWWEESGSKKTVAASEATNAVEILTLHKAKGLQFPVVFIPFANWPIRPSMSSHEWYKNEFESLGEVDFYLSVTESKAKDIGGSYSDKYLESFQLHLFDAINMLYVAMTRPVERLYMYVPPFREKNIGTFIQNYIQEQTGSLIYEIGERTPAQKAQELPAERKRGTWDVNPWEDKLSLSSSAPPHWYEGGKSPRFWGNLVHAVLEHTNNPQSQIDRFTWEGKINDGEAKTLARIIQEIVHHPELEEYYSENSKSLNERDILVPEFSSKRPDKMVLHSDKSLTLIDYKTGEKLNKHVKQIDEYGQLLEEAGYEKIEKVLIYVSEKVEEVIKWT